MNQKERFVLALVALLKSKQEFNPQHLAERVEQCLPLKRPEKALLDSEQKKEFERLAKKYRAQGLIAK